MGGCREPLCIRFTLDELLLDVLNRAELILEIVDRLSLFIHLELVIIRMVCNLLKQFLHVHVGYSRSFNVF